MKDLEIKGGQGGRGVTKRKIELGAKKNFDNDQKKREKHCESLTFTYTTTFHTEILV